MSTYVYMRILESAPHRYDLGIRVLSLGRATALYEAAADAAVADASAPRVLEIGCGTGNLTRLLSKYGAIVTAIDHNPDMLAIAQEKLAEARDRVELREMAAVEIADRFPAESFEAVVSTLTFSEMSDDEQRYVLEAAQRVLRPGGRVIIADEVRPERLWQRLLHACLRWPVAVLTYILTQTTTSAVTDLANTVRSAGFHIVREDRTAYGSMSILVAEKQ